MGVQIIIKGANFSAFNLGKIATAKSFIDAAGITNLNQKNALMDLVDSLVLAGLWDKMDAIYPFVGGTESAHKFNLKDPRDLDAAYRLAFTGGVHSSNGFNGAGAGYGKTFIVPKSLQNKHLSLYNNSASASGVQQVAFGVLANNTATNYQMWLARSYTNLTRSAFGEQSATSVAGYDVAKKGFLLGQRVSLTDVKLYDAGAQIASNITAVVDTFAANTNAIHIGALQLADGTIGNFANLSIAFASYGTALTTQNITDLNTIVVAFQTALGRQ